MKISEHWLRQWVDPPIGTDQLAEQLTMAGLEVEEVHRISQGFTNVIVAEIRAITPHPAAAQLKVCEVAAGKSDTITVVSGAANARVGLKTAFARPGAKLPGGKVLAATDIKGVTSEGMLCSAAELGLAGEAEGILELPANTVPGQDLGALFTGSDAVLEFSLTPNRGDCLSVAGIAREVAALNNCRLRAPSIRPVTAAGDRQRMVRLEASEACPHYAGRIIADVDVTLPAPPWLVERLHRSGLRTINAVVDILNYVMLELGQPMHAFDADTLEGAVRVRFAGDDEKIVLLDQQEYPLSGGTLVIADDQKVLAIAGIMGGLDSAVTAASRQIFLESAWFDPRTITAQSRRYGLRTDSSHRFERGVDFTLQRPALERATRLILDICGGTPGPITEEAANRPETPEIALHSREIERLLGLRVAPETVRGILRRLGMPVKSGKGGWQVRPPPYRYDIAIEADLIEEIARIYGYQAIPAELPQAALHCHDGEQGINVLQQVSRLLAHRGYQEAITYSFVDKALQDQLMSHIPGQVALELANPIASDLAVMRTSLWPGLLGALQYNLKRQQARVRLFEAGRVFRMDGDGIDQDPMIGGVSYGNVYGKQWNKQYKSCSFFDIKADVEAILNTAGCNFKAIEFRPSSHPALHPGQSAEIVLENQIVGYVGQLHPRLRKQFNIPQATYLFELKIDSISAQIAPRYRKISKFPAVQRDLAVVVAETVPAAAVLDCIARSAPEVLTNLELFDVYQGEGIDLGKKSLALGLTFQKSSSTLIEEEVEAIIGEILARLRGELGATLRE